jgi:hypothetical protein
MIAVAGLNVFAGQVGSWPGLLLVFGLLAAVLSAVYCHSAIYVYWTRHRGGNVTNYDLLQVIQVVVRRTIRYRKAFSFSLISVSFLLLFEISRGLAQTGWRYSEAEYYLYGLDPADGALLVLAVIPLRSLVSTFLQKRDIDNFPQASDLARHRFFSNLD